MADYSREQLVKLNVIQPGKLGEKLEPGKRTGLPTKTARWQLPDEYRDIAQALHEKEAPTYKVITYGCQMNEHDSEILAGQLEKMGYQPGDSEYNSDIVLLNTCAIRENAEEKVWGKLGELKKYKSRNPSMIVGLAGCMAQEPGVVERIRDRVPHTDLVLGTHNIHELPTLIRQHRLSNETIIDVWKSAGPVVEDLPKERVDGVKAWLNIIYGCDKFCTYCIVPHTRGRERSRQPEDILAEARELAASGIMEITLLGQTVNSYGSNLEQDYDFADLLHDLDQLDGLRRIRYMSPHPRWFSERLIDTIARSEKVCEHFHLPLQSGSDAVLRRMNRRYTREEYLQVVEWIRERIPGASITTDIIVGFPGETEQDFQDTLEVVRTVGYDNAFTFMYSPRAGTPAARWEDQVPGEVKKDRLNRLMDVQYPLSLAKNKEKEGRVVPVLVEGPSKKDDTVLSARMRTNDLVLIPVDDPQLRQQLVDTIVDVRITEANTWTLYAELC